MFICAVTKKPSNPGESPTKLVVQSRPRTYIYHEDEAVECRKDSHRLCPDNRLVSVGTEIVQEVMVSAEGLKILEGLRETQ
jgi:hypothetical protein